MLSSDKEAELLGKIMELREDKEEYLLVIGPPYIMGFWISAGKPWVYDPPMVYRLDLRQKHRGLRELTDDIYQGYIVCQGKPGFLRAARDLVLAPELKRVAETSGPDNNYWIIKGEVDKFSGRYWKDGYYFIGATSSAEDYYYLYWNPTEKDFKYQSCCRALEPLDWTKNLPENDVPELLREIEEQVTDAMFPSKFLGT